jgi:hypothetical protein
VKYTHFYIALREQSLSVNKYKVVNEIEQILKQYYHKKSMAATTHLLFFCGIYGIFASPEELNQQLQPGP